MKKGRTDGCSHPKNTDAQRRLIDYHLVSINIKHIGLRFAIRLLDGMIWLLDVLIALRGDDRHSTRRR